MQYLDPRGLHLCNYVCMHPENSRQAVQSLIEALERPIHLCPDVMLLLLWMIMRYTLNSKCLVECGRSKM